jgi:hypothetical protein
MALMASLRARNRTDGSAYYAVLYRLDGKQSSTSFKNLADRFGPAKALEIVGTDTPLQTITVGQWLEHPISHQDHGAFG